MRIAEINQWLNSSRPFPQGVALYEKHSHLKPNAGAQIIIGGAESTLSKNILARELTAIFNLDSPPVDEITDVAAATPAPRSAPSKTSFKFSPEILATMPAPLQAKWELIKKLYGQMDIQRGRMLAVYYDESNKLRKHPDSHIGGTLALEILSTDKRIKQCYEELDAWVEKGTITPIADEKEVEFLRDSLESVVRLSYYVKRNESRQKKGEAIPNPKKLEAAQGWLKTINEYLSKHGRRSIS